VKKDKPKRKYTKKVKGPVLTNTTVEQHTDGLGRVHQMVNIPQPPTNHVETMTEKRLIEYMDAFGLAKKLTPTEKLQFISIAREFNLNPFKREIHVQVYNENTEDRTLSMVVGYEVYLKRAERLHVLDGWSVKTEGDGDTLKAVAEIYRKDRKHPFIHEVWYKEAVQTKRDGTANHFWKKMPRFMLKKVAAAQAFRLCFPDDMGGIPFIEGEPDPALDEKEETKAPKRIEMEPIIYPEATIQAEVAILKAAAALDAEILDAEKIVGSVPDAQLFQAIVKKCNESKDMPTEKKVKAMADARNSKMDPDVMRRILASL
jgi:phage recombination protein Bet